MAEYLSGGRIQGSSTASPVAGGYVSIDNESASSTSGSLATSIDLLGTNISDSSWVLRFKYNVTGGSNGIGSTLAFGLTDLPYTTAGTQTQKCFGFKIANGEGGATAGAVDMFPAPDELDPQTHIDFSSLPFVRYFELRRLSATGSAQYTLKAYTTSDYTGTPATADRNPAGITGLRYFKIANYTAASNTGGVEGKVTDLKFWNNEQDTTEDPDVDILQSSGSFTSGTWGSVVSPPTSPANGFLATTSYTDEKTTITDVPIGTRYEETNTRKIYRYAEGVAAYSGYNQTNVDEDVPLRPSWGGGTRGGVKIQSGHTLIGNAINKVTFCSKKNGSPSGTAYLRIWGSSEGGDEDTVRYEVGSKLASEFPTSRGDVVFENTTATYTIRENDTIALDYTAGDASNNVTWGMKNSSTPTSENVRDYPSNSWRTQSGRQTCYKAEKTAEADSWKEKGTA